MSLLGVLYTLLNLFINSSSFLVNSLGLSLYRITAAKNRTVSFFSTYFWVLSISFSCLIALARTQTQYWLAEVTVAILLDFLFGGRGHFQSLIIESGVSCL